MPLHFGVLLLDRLILLLYLFKQLGALDSHTSLNVERLHTFFIAATVQIESAIA